MGLFSFFNGKNENSEHDMESKLNQYRHLLGNDSNAIPNEELEERLKTLSSISQTLKIRPEQLSVDVVKTYTYIFSQGVKDVVSAVRNNKDNDIETIKEAARDALHWCIDYYKSGFWEKQSSLDSTHYRMMLKTIEEDIANKYINCLVK